MATRKELKKMAQTRLKEAKALFNNGYFDGACYLAGYVIELALKARICKVLDLNEYPDTGEISRSFKTHKLDILLKLSGLENKFQNDRGQNVDLDANWLLLTDEWSEQIRYNPIGTSRRQNAAYIINALEHPNNGVFTWIKKRW